MAAPEPAWPRLTSVELRAPIDAFRRRQKAIRHRTNSWSVRHDFDDVERLDLDFGCSDRTRVLLTLWIDHLLFIRTCRPQPRAQGGWAFNEAIYGNWNEIPLEELVSNVEDTLRLHVGADSKDIRVELGRLWESFHPRDTAEHVLAGREQSQGGL